MSKTTDNESITHPINLRSTVKATERYRTYLRIASLFLKKPLTSMEMDIMDEFYHQKSGIIDTESRKAVREVLGISPEHLNNYIRALRKKNIIIDQPGTDTISLHPSFLQPMPEDKIMNISINLQVVL